MLSKALATILTFWILCVQQVKSKDNPVYHGEQYFIDDVMRFATIECWTNQTVEPKPKGTVRIAVVGDSTTVGVGSNRSTLDFKYDHHLQTDGSKAGYRGFPYLLYQLFKNHNKTQSYQIMNFGNDNFTLFPDQIGRNYRDLCEYRQLLSSDPDVVIAMLGAKESMNEAVFKPKDFVDQYNAFVQDMKNLPSSPHIMLVSPIYSASSIIATQKPFKLNQLDNKQFLIQKTTLPDWDYAQTDIANLVSKVAEKNKLPSENFIDSEQVIKFDNANTMASEIHPNEHGYGVLAQELYMRLAFSPKIKQKIDEIYEDHIDFYEWKRHVQEQNKLKEAQSNVSRQSLTQNKQKQSLKIDLSDMCHDQSYQQAKEALMPGLKFKFQVPPPQTSNEIRIAIAGDSTTQGFTGSSSDNIRIKNLSQRLQDQTDGSQQGLQGWPYLLHSLLQNNNKSIDYSILNYGVSATTIMSGANFNSFYDTCRYEQLKKSLPNFVFLSFGGMDQHLRNYSEEEFIKSYTKLIGEIQSLPTRPMVFLMVPTYTCQHELKFLTNPEFKKGFVNSSAECSKEQKQDLQMTILKIANLTQIPTNHIVNAWSFIRDPKRKVPAISSDDIHPNLKGQGEIAQEFFMKMSLSPAFMSRQKTILMGQDQVYNMALQAEYKKQGLALDLPF